MSDEDVHDQIEEDNSDESEEEVEDMEGVNEGDEEIMPDLEGIDEKIEQCKAKIEDNSIDYDATMELLKLLRLNGDLDELNETREKAVAKFPLPAEEWKNWIEDAKTMEGTREEIETLFRRALSDITSVQLWQEFVIWGFGDMETVRDKFDDALTAIGFRVDVGGEGSIWEMYADYEEALLQGGGDEQRKRVQSLYARAMRVPSMALKRLRERYEQFAGDEVDSSIINSFKTSLKTLLEAEKYEKKLESAAYSIESYNEYLNWEMERKEPARVTSFYERILEKHYLDENVWLDYTQYLTDHLKIPSVTLGVYKRAVRFCPSSVALWQSLLLAMEKANENDEEIDTLWKNAKANIDCADNGRSLYRTYVYLLKRRADAKGDKDWTKVAEVIDEGAKILAEYFGRQWDPHGEYRKMQAFFHYDKMKDPKKGRAIWEDILASGGGRFAEKWLEAAMMERFYGNINNVRSLFYKAVNSVSDHPQSIYTTFIQFEREEGNIEQLEKALAKVNSQRLRRAEMAPVKEKKEKEEPKKSFSVKSSFEDGKGRKRPGDVQESAHGKKIKTDTQKHVDKDGFVMPSLPVGPLKPPTNGSQKASTSNEKKNSDDEEAKKWTVFVSNLDFKTTPEQIKEVLDGVVDIRLSYRGMSKLHKGFAYVDVEDEEAYKDALSKDRVPIKGRPMYVSQNKEKEQRDVLSSSFKYATSLEANKLFVKNVHYDATSEQLKEVFSQFGAVKDVRIVTHKSGKAKGIAYVDMESNEDAQSAVKADEVILIDRKLTVLLSNPGKKDATHVSRTVQAPQTGRIGHSSKIDFVPRNVVKKKEEETEEKKEGNGTTVEKKGNDFFRQLISGGKK